MKVQPTLEQSLLKISTAVINIRSLDDFYTFVIGNIKPYVQFDDAVLVLLSEDNKFSTKVISIPSEERVAHPHYKQMVQSDLTISDSPFEDMLNSQPIDYFSLDKMFAKHSDYPGLILMKDTGLNHTISVQLENSKGIFALLLFHFEDTPVLPNKNGMYAGIKNQLELALQNILANEEVLEEKAFKETLLSFSKDLSKERTKKGLIKTINDKMQKIFLFNYCVIVTKTKDGLSQKQWFISVDEKLQASNILGELEEVILPIADTPFELIFQHQSVSFSDKEDLNTYPDFPGTKLYLEMGLEKSLVLPLFQGGKHIGVLLFHYDTPEKLDNVNLALAENAANQISVVVSNILANEEILAEKALKETLLSISEAATGIYDRDDLYKVIMEKLKPIVNFGDVVLIRFNEDLSKHRHILSESPLVVKEHPLFGSIFQIEMETKGTIVERFIGDERIIPFNTISGLKDYPNHIGIQMMKDANLNYSNTLQLRAGNQLFAVLIFHFEKQETRDAITKNLYLEIANQLSLSIRNVFANEEILEEKAFKETLLSISEAATGIYDRDDLYKAIMNKIKPVVYFDDAVLATYSNDLLTHQHILTMSPLERVEHPLYNEVLSTEVKTSGTPMEQFVKTERLVHFDTASSLVDYPKHNGLLLMKSTGLNYSVSIQLLNAGNIFAVLIFHFEKEETRNATSDELYIEIANQIGLALKNVLANEEILAEKAFKETLLSISEVATKIRDREDLYSAIMGQIRPIVHFDDAVFIVFSENFETYSHILTISPMERKNHPFYDKIVGQHLPTKNSPLYDMVHGEDLQLTDTKIVLETYPKHIGFRLMKDTGLNYSVVLKLYQGSDFFALLIFHFEKEENRNATSNELCIEIANQVGLALRNVLANEEIKNLNKQLQEEKNYLQEEIRHTHNFENIIGDSEPMQQVFEMISQVAPSTSTVIILGETGTGKELIARAIHNRSSRNEQPLIKVNCAALPAQLLESELFGHERGAFTGASERRIGKFELAHKGTIFLDEIGEIPLELQSKLLRVIQEREIERLGGNKVIKIDTRIIVATNRNLEKEVQEGDFRADLFFRLNVFPIILPPLRNRTEDIAALATHFLQRFSKRIGKRFKGFSKTSIKQMLTYQWPGNVRELEHLVERAIITAKEEVLKIDLSAFKANGKKKGEDISQGFEIKSLQENERELIINTLRHCGGKVRGKNGAAELLDINPSTLESRMRKLKIKKAFI